jgi:hypothetical protein
MQRGTRCRFASGIVFTLRLSRRSVPDLRGNIACRAASGITCCSSPCGRVLIPQALGIDVDDQRG